MKCQIIVKKEKKIEKEVIPWMWMLLAPCPRSTNFFQKTHQVPNTDRSHDLETRYHNLFHSNSSKNLLHRTYQHNFLE